MIMGSKTFLKICDSLLIEENRRALKRWQMESVNKKIDHKRIHELGNFLSK